MIADTATNKIWRGDLPLHRGSSYTEIPIPANTTYAPRALDFDPVERRIYWSDNFTVSSIKLDGTDRRILLNETDFGGG